MHCLCQECLHATPTHMPGTVFYHVIPRATGCHFCPCSVRPLLQCFSAVPSPPTYVALMVTLTEHMVLMFCLRASAGLQQWEQVSCLPLLGPASFPATGTKRGPPAMQNVHQVVADLMERTSLASRVLFSSTENCITPGVSNFCLIHWHCSTSLINMNSRPICWQ
jgi:hypothetical protein